MALLDSVRSKLLGGDAMTDQKRKLTVKDIEATISSEHYFTAGDGIFGSDVIMCGSPVTNVDELNRLTFCVLVLQIQDAPLGRPYARKGAILQIWALEGYLLYDRLYSLQAQ